MMNDHDLNPAVAYDQEDLGISVAEQNELIKSDGLSKKDGEWLAEFVKQGLIRSIDEYRKNFAYIRKMQQDADDIQAELEKIDADFASIEGMGMSPDNKMRKINKINESLKKAEQFLASKNNPFRNNIDLKKQDKAKYSDQIYAKAKEFFDARERTLPRIKEAIKDLTKKRMALIANPIAKISWKAFHGLVTTIRDYWEVVAVTVAAATVVVGVAVIAVASLVGKKNKDNIKKDKVVENAAIPTSAKDDKTTNVINKEQKDEQLTGIIKENTEINQKSEPRSPVITKDIKADKPDLKMTAEEELEKIFETHGKSLDALPNSGIDKLFMKAACAGNHELVNIIYNTYIKQIEKLPINVKDSSIFFVYGVKYSYPRSEACNKFIEYLKLDEVLVEVIKNKESSKNIDFLIVTLSYMTSAVTERRENIVTYKSSRHPDAGELYDRVLPVITKALHKAIATEDIDIYVVDKLGRLLSYAVKDCPKSKNLKITDENLFYAAVKTKRPQLIESILEIWHNENKNSDHIIGFVGKVLDLSTDVLRKVCNKFYVNVEQTDTILYACENFIRKCRFDEAEIILEKHLKAAGVEYFSNRLVKLIDIRDVKASSNDMYRIISFMFKKYGKTDGNLKDGLCNKIGSIYGELIASGDDTAANIIIGLCEKNVESEDLKIMRQLGINEALVKAAQRCDHERIKSIFETLNDEERKEIQLNTTSETLMGAASAWKQQSMENNSKSSRIIEGKLISNLDKNPEVENKYKKFEEDINGIYNKNESEDRKTLSF